MQMRVKLSDLELKDSPEPEVESEYVTMSKGPSPGIELDIRGRRVDEGLAELTIFVDKAYLARMPWVRIIHGKGTGKLRTAVRKSLKQNPNVLSWEEGKDGEGGDGVTVVKFTD
jgi:DNA mismatch repair protein MutS2